MGLTKKFEEDSPRPACSVDTGDWGETIAVEHLVALGYAIVATKWRSGNYEVDIVAQKGARMVFVEVKTRKTAFSDPVEAVNQAKQRRIIRSADVYLQQLDAPFEYQFDIITIVGDRSDYKLTHYPDAFFPSMTGR